MPTPMTQSDKQRIQSSQATGGKNMTSSGFSARAQSAADRNSAAQGASSDGFTGLGRIGLTQQGGNNSGKTGGK